MAQPDSDFKEEEHLKKDLKFYFMNPCEKYRARRQIPWKLGLQILKIVMVTTQVLLFFKKIKQRRNTEFCHGVFVYGLANKQWFQAAGMEES